MEGVGHHGTAESLGARALEHGLAEIGTGDLGGGAGALDGEGEVAAAGGEVKQGGGMPGGDERGGAATPEEIEAAREKVVGEVVPSGDGREEGVDELWLLQVFARANDWRLRRQSGYLRGQMMRIKKARLTAVRTERATRKL